MTALLFAVSTEEQKTAGGIILPDNATEKPQEGEILAVGAGGRDDGGRVITLLTLKLAIRLFLANGPVRKL